ncbi:ribosome binding protein, putative [Babesia ovata]|uniref:Ribosome binding protein, putative n=1 Tax=Babesia ovata TaxID=189622 RepID=A0A2H6KFW5_9APIC|nr:ribosome binding protein, putative [Babesia ovata]GBE61893.1 ribosome binding protein, putative [Babesia ovata]
MTKHGIPLNTLKECLQFLLWLNSRKDVQKQVADVLVNRYGNSYNHISFTGKLPADVSKFLEHVSTFYEKLVATPIKERYIDPQAKDVTEALLDCIPKFLAALYFLLYNVDYRFDAVGGGKWKYNYPGWEPTWSRHFWQKEYGGGLQDYLRVSLSDKYGDLIPGGFGPEEVTYGYDYNSIYGYWYGESMVNDLKAILDKHNHKYNDFRDVFFTTVISKSGAGTHKVNTANVLALVKTFCEIVAAEEKKLNGEKFKTHLEKGTQNKRICWNNLVAHCKNLEQQLGKLFNEKAFSFTGQARTVDQLNTERFAGETAVWFRNNLHEVQHNVQRINKDFPVDNTRHLNVLQQFATTNIFPYGFIFGKARYGTMSEAWKTLSNHWDSTMIMLGKNGDGLDKLKTLLDGERCHHTAPPKPRPRPAPRPPRPARPVPPPRPARASGGRTTGTRGGGGWSSVGSRASGARGGNTGGGAHKRRGETQNRVMGSGAQRDRGGPGPGGARAAKGRQGSRSPRRTMSTQSPHLHRQSTSQSHPQQPSHSAPRVPIPLAEILPTPPHSVSQTSVRGPSSASSSRSSSPSVTNAGGTGLGPQVPISGHSQQSSQDSAPNQDSNPRTPGQHSDSGGGGGGPGGAAGSSRGMDENSTGSVLTASKPVVSLSIDLSQAQSAPRDVQSAGHDSDPGRPGSSLPQANSNHDGSPGPIGTPAHQDPGTDGKVSSGINPVVSSNAMNSQTSRVQTPDSLSSVALPVGAQDLKDQAHSSTQDISHQSSEIQSTHQGTPGVDNLPSAANRAGPGGDEANGGGGVSAGGTDGDSQVDSHSGKSSNAPQPSVRLHTPALSAAGPPSDISGSPGDLGLTLPSPSKVNPQGHTDDAGRHSPTAIPQAPGQAPLGNSDAAVTRAQQHVGTQDNGSPGQLGPPPPVPPPPPSAPPPSPPAAPVSPAKPGGGGAVLQSNASSGSQPGSPQVKGPPQPPSVTGPGPGSTGGGGADPHGSGGAGQDVGQASGKTPSSVATPSDAMAAGAGGGGRDPQSQVIDKKDSQNCPAGATEVTAVNSQGYICWPPPPSMKTPARIIPYDQRPSSLILKKLNDQESNALKEEEKEKHKQHAINVAFANSFNGSKITPPDPIEYYYGGLTGNVVRDDSGVIRQKSFLEKSLDASKQIFEESKSKLQALDNDRKRSMYFGGGGVDIRIPNKPLNVSFEITKPLDRNADKFPDPLLTALHDPEEFGLGGEEVYAEDYPLVSGVGGEPVDLRQKLYEKQKVEVEKLNRVLEEGEEKRKEAEAQYAFDQFKGKNDFLKDLWKVEDFRISGPPSPQTDEQKIDLRIDVPKPILQDPVHDFDFDEDSTHINDDALSNSVAPYKPAISLNVLPPKAKQLPPPTTDFDRSKINRQTLPMCIPDWSTKTPTHDATDIPRRSCSLRGAAYSQGDACLDGRTATPEAPRDSETVYY